MINAIDNFLNRVTMYRLVIYYLVLVLAAGIVFAFFGLLPYSPAAIFLSAVLILAVSWFTNEIFARVSGAPSNRESVVITALILTLIVAPFQSTADWPLLAWVAILAIASKYVLAIRRKHLFNPAALGILVTALVLNQSANWWVGNLYLTLFVLIGGLMIVRKIRRFDLVLSFFIIASLTILGSVVLKNGNWLTALNNLLFHSSFFFFALVMLTEPATTPPDRLRRLAYGALVGFLFAPAVHLGSLYSTPELALLVGNVFVYLVSPKQKLILTLKEKIPAAAGVTDFVFSTNQRLAFQPGQYLEWTLDHAPADNRGIRRYFTIASAPTEADLRLGVKFYNPPSSFKRTLFNLEPGQTMVASQLAGDFTLPRNPRKKLVFIAGGIGVTPFRSMVAELLASREKRDIVMFYANRSDSDAAYRHLFEQARRELGLKLIYVTGRTLDSAVIQSQVPDWSERIFYLSGPQGLVVSFKQALREMGVARRRIRTDYFPGFA